MQQQKIEFRRERDFGGVLGDSLKFLKQNFKSFFASVIFIVGPFILLMGLGYAYMQTSMLDAGYRLGGANAYGAGRLDVFNSTYFMSIGVSVFCGLLASILLSAVVYNYMLLYQEKPLGEQITVSEVGKKVWESIGRLTASSFAFFIVAILVVGVTVVICIGIITILGFGGGLLIGLAVIVLGIIYTPVISYLIPAAFFVVVRDGEFIFTAMGKVRKYLSGNFWWTWLIMIVTMIALAVLQMVFNLPASGLAMVKMFSRVNGTLPGDQDNNILLMALYTIGIFLTYCTTSISHLIAAFNFMSHEEKHEGQGLMSRINEIG
jgi:hypothetical protein